MKGEGESSLGRRGRKGTVTIPSLASCFVAGHQSLPPLPTGSLSQKDAIGSHKLTQREREMLLYALADVGQGLCHPSLYPSTSLSSPSALYAGLLRRKIGRLFQVYGSPMLRANGRTYRLFSLQYVRAVEQHVLRYGKKKELIRRYRLVIQAEGAKDEELELFDRNDDGKDEWREPLRGPSVKEEVEEEEEEEEEMEEEEELRESETTPRRGEDDSSGRKGLSLSVVTTEEGHCGVGGSDTAEEEASCRRSGATKFLRTQWRRGGRR